MWQTVDVGPESHVMPEGDLRAHVPAVFCWCQPQRKYDAPLILRHFAADGRAQPERMPS